MSAFGGSCEEKLSACDIALQSADKLITDQNAVISAQAALILTQKDQINLLEKKGNAFYEKEWFWFAAGALSTAYIAGQLRK